MKKLLAILLALFVFASSADARKPRPDKGGTHKSYSTRTYTAPSKKTVHVREYKHKDGTVVHAHDRRAPGTK